MKIGAVRDRADEVKRLGGRRLRPGDQPGSFSSGLEPGAVAGPARARRRPRAPRYGAPRGAADVAQGEVFGRSTNTADMRAAVDALHHHVADAFGASPPSWTPPLFPGMGSECRSGYNTAKSSSAGFGRYVAPQWNAPTKAASIAAPQRQRRPRAGARPSRCRARRPRTTPPSKPSAARVHPSEAAELFTRRHANHLSRRYRPRRRHRREGIYSTSEPRGEPVHIIEPPALRLSISDAIMTRPTGLAGRARRRRIILSIRPARLEMTVRARRHLETRCVRAVMTRIMEG